MLNHAPLASTSLLAAAGSGIVFGVLHGLGPDHCAALASLLVRDRGALGPARVSLRFGVGHALALGALGLAAGSMGLLIPEAWESRAEVFSGCLLILVGALALHERSGGLLIHRHEHDHDGSHHAHWHAHMDAAGSAQASSRGGDGADRAVHHSASPHRHGHLNTLLGGAFGLSGVRALTLALPPLLLAGNSWLSGLAFVACFGIGVMAAMLAFGLLFRVASTTVERHAGEPRGGGRRGAPRGTSLWVGRAIGVVSIALGVYWVVTNLGG